MSSSVAAEAQGRVAQKSLSTGMTLLLATACGLTAANIYYAQPLIGLIAPDIGLGETAASLIVTFTQVGYCLGLILLVPLGDLLENRGLIFSTLCAAVLALIAAAFAPNGAAFLAAALLIGTRLRRHADARAGRRAPFVRFHARLDHRQRHERAPGRRHAGAPGLEPHRQRLRLAKRVHRLRRRDGDPRLHLAQPAARAPRRRSTIPTSS